MKRAWFTSKLASGLRAVSVKAALSGAAAAVVLAASPAANAETLADALADAYKNSGLLDQNRAVLRAADEDVAQAVSALRPVLGWAADVTRQFGTTRSSQTLGNSAGFVNETATIGLSVTQLLWDGGSSRKQIEVAKQTVLATRQALVSVEQNVLLQAVDAYTQVRTSNETLALRRNNVRVITEELRAAKDRFEVGEVTRTDVAQAEARLAQARAALAQAQGDLASAEEFFIAAVGRKPGRLATPTQAPVSAKTPAEAKAVAQRNHPDVLASQLRVAAADLGVEIARAATKPTVSLTGRYGSTQTRDSDNFNRGGSVTLEASGPIYAGGRIASVVRQASQQRDSARAQLHLATLAVSQNAGTAYANLQVARAAREAGQRQVRFAQIAFDGVREEASLGARTTLNVLNAEQELLNAKANLINAVANEYLASYALLANMGLLTADTLRLNVPRYDPEAYYQQVNKAPASISAQGRQLDKMLRRLGKE
ncbi:TolC family outer membrane protein [Thalassobius sp. Cn5-15]|uniref:TolC family outer membrane protein n=1 Tax=Thalassobius sp. Cn5-15 TaxID=2917763 RepID=UPI001EF197E3|nr:TolC family outer membrane protein [Thalassobius sp. Cn5-15]MCG7492938.1 TolC family outer membrane protein [Thalassobius sp. Cn5-15]